MGWNAYLAVNHLTKIQGIAARTLESSMIQAGISSVLRDLIDMETGQRGYLLTKSFVLATLYRREGKDWNRFCWPSCWAR